MEFSLSTLVREKMAGVKSLISISGLPLPKLARVQLAFLMKDVSGGDLSSRSQIFWMAPALTMLSLK